MGGDNDRVGWGLRLDVFRNADVRPVELGTVSRGGISWRFPVLVLVGIVDYRNAARSATGGNPTIDYVPRSARAFEPSGERPPVWLVLSWRWDRHMALDQFLMPGDLETGQPDAGRWTNGGNYADGDSRFTDLVGHNHAVRIHDYALDAERQRERDRGWL